MNEVRLAFRDATAKSRITVGIKEPRAQTRGAARDSRLSHRATRRSACRLLDANPPASTQMATLAAEQQRPGAEGLFSPWNELKRVVCDGAECRARTEAAAAPDSPAPPHRQEHNASRQGSAPLRSRRRLPCSPRQEGRGVADEMPVRQRRQLCVGRREPARECGSLAPHGAASHGRALAASQQFRERRRQPRVVAELLAARANWLAPAPLGPGSIRRPARTRGLSVGLRARERSS